MNLVGCLHPVEIRHKYTNELIAVPCGKCEYCRQVRNNIWTQRLQVEAANSSYCLFVTLKYDDANVPRVHADYIDGVYTLYCDENERDSGLYEEFDGNDKYVTARYANLGTGSLYRLSRIDIQSTVKRMRSYIKYHIYGDPSIRYYIVGEYGPTTYRPHYHGLFFFENYNIAKYFTAILASAWKYGNFSWRYSTGADINYTAAYLNCIDDYPSVYRSPLFKPFSLKSTRNPLGCRKVSNQEIQAHFADPSIGATIPDLKKHSVRRVPLFGTLRRRYFPKFKGSCMLNSSWFLYVCRRLYKLFDRKTDYKLYLVRLMDSMKYDRTMFGDYLRFYWRAPKSSSGHDSMMYGLFYFVSHVVDAAIQFGLTFTEYCKKLYDYYKKSDYENLKRQLRFEQDYS